MKSIQQAIQESVTTPVLYIKEASGRYKPVNEAVILEAGKAILSEAVKRGPTMGSPRTVREYLSFELGALDHEVFSILWLDNQHQVIKYEQMFVGTIDACSVHPREVVKAGLSCNAAACILAHNHPSGVVTASQADKHITEKLVECLALVSIRILDHVIVGGNNTLSFAETGLI